MSKCNSHISYRFSCLPTMSRQKCCNKKSRTVDVSHTLLEEEAATSRRMLIINSSFLGSNKP